MRKRNRKSSAILTAMALVLMGCGESRNEPAVQEISDASTITSESPVESEMDQSMQDEGETASADTSITQPDSESDTETTEDIEEITDDDARKILDDYLASTLIPEYGVFDDSQTGTPGGPTAEYSATTGDPWLDAAGIFTTDEYDYDSDGQPEMLIIVIRKNPSPEADPYVSGQNYYPDLYETYAELYDVNESGQARKTDEIQLEDVDFDGYEGMASPFVLARNTVDNEPCLEYYCDRGLNYRSDASANRYVHLIAVKDGEFENHYKLETQVALSSGFATKVTTWDDGEESSSILEGSENSDPEYGTWLVPGTNDATNATGENEGYANHLSGWLSDAGIQVDSSFQFTGDDAVQLGGLNIEKDYDRNKASVQVDDATGFLRQYGPGDQSKDTSGNDDSKDDATVSSGSTSDLEDSSGTVASQVNLTGWYEDPNDVNGWIDVTDNGDGTITVGFPGIRWLWDYTYDRDTGNYVSDPDTGDPYILTFDTSSDPVTVTTDPHDPVNNGGSRVLQKVE